MTDGAQRPRPRPRSLWSGAFLIPALACALPLAAQVPVPTDTLPPVPDTLALPVPADTVPPPAEPRPPGAWPLPALPPPGPAGFDVGVWEWDRAALLMLPDLTLLHLLERIPGFVPVRSYPVGQPEAAAVFGSAMGAVTWIVDGYHLDPLTTPTFDPSRLALVAIASVRVERRVTGATVRLTTLAPTDERPVSIIEAATGDLATNLFRGTFMAPRVLGGPLALGFERLASAGFPGGSVNNTVAWLRWGWTGENGGLQLDYRRSEMDRAGVGPGLSGARSDWVMRARRRLGGVAAEVYAGASAVEDAADSFVLREGGPQGGVRVQAPIPVPVPAEASASLRLRAHDHAPRQEVELAAWAQPLPLLGVGGEVVRGWWADGDPTGRWEGRVRAGPLRGVTAFAGVFGGGPDVRAPRVADPPLDATRRGVRAGAEVGHRGFLLGGAAVIATADSVPGFGLAFDSTAPAFTGGEISGFEAHVRLPTGWDPIRVEGWYVRMAAPAGWLYLPDDHWRVALSYYHVPLLSGNLEIRARAEYLFRGRMDVPQAGALTQVGAIRSTDLELTIRVLDVHAFARWENIFHRRLQQDLPDMFRPGQNIAYGVKWHFWN